MLRNAFLAMTLVFGVAACGGPSVVKRGTSTPPPGETQLSPHDADVQYGDSDRNKERS